MRTVWKVSFFVGQTTLFISWTESLKKPIKFLPGNDLKAKNKLISIPKASTNDFIKNCSSDKTWKETIADTTITPAAINKILSVREELFCVIGILY